MLTLGEFNTEFSNSIQEFLFIFGTMFLMLTLLNLVIALMSDAYEEVMSGITEQDAFDTNLMIIDVEKMYFMNRQKGEDTYFYSMDYSDENAGEWKSQVQFVTQFMASSQDRLQNEITAQLTEMKNQMEANFKTIIATEQDHFETSRKIRKNIDNYFNKK